VFSFCHGWVVHRRCGMVLRRHIHVVVGCYGGEMGLGAATKARWLAF
jgi:hypothetical protein